MSVVEQAGGIFFFKGFTSVLHLTQRVKFSDKERLYLSVRSVVKNAHFTPVALYNILYRIYNNPTRKALLNILLIVGDLFNFINKPSHCDCLLYDGKWL